jgi:hypothetical protein
MPGIAVHTSLNTVGNIVVIGFIAFCFLYDELVVYKERQVLPIPRTQNVSTT